MERFRHSRHICGYFTSSVDAYNGCNGYENNKYAIFTQHLMQCSLFCTTGFTVILDVKFKDFTRIIKDRNVHCATLIIYRNRMEITMVTC